MDQLAQELTGRPHVTLIGAQTIPNLLPAIQLRPRHAVMISTRDLEAGNGAAHPADCLRDCLHQLGITSERVDVESGFDVAGVRNAVREALQRHLDAIVNITGGTKLMMLGAGQAAGDAESPMLYLDTLHRAIHVFVGQQRAQFPLTARANLELTLAAHGWHVRDYRQFSEEDAGRLGGSWRRCRSGGPSVASWRPTSLLRPSQWRTSRYGGSSTTCTNRRRRACSTSRDLQHSPSSISGAPSSTPAMAGLPHSSRPNYTRLAPRSLLPTSKWCYAWQRMPPNWRRRWTWPPSRAGGVHLVQIERRPVQPQAAPRVGRQGVEVRRIVRQVGGGGCVRAQRKRSGPPTSSGG